ncbi:putative porin [Maribacter chungangensis]|uniref:Porin n=1 Tax=Maribacter chungangensis TaxID=1069117 RepID=A0ABW3B6V1_9FLAO
MKYFLTALFLLVAFGLMAQETEQESGLRPSADSIARTPRTKTRELPLAAMIDTVSIRNYKLISHQRDTTFLDTTLTIQKEYKYNYLRADDFELMPFGNIGQGYNKLGVDFERSNLYPRLGARAKHHRYREIEEMQYYNVMTPMTDLMFKTTLEEGQLLDALLTFNTSRRLNISIGYTGFRSLGKYNSEQIQSGNFISTVNYVSKNDRYLLRAHIAAQDITSQENGGLTEKELQFESGDDDFIDRPKVDVRFTDADNKVLGKRYYVDQQYKLIRSRQDSSLVEKTSLAITHSFNYETKFYQYLQDASDSYFGDAILGSINDKASLKVFNNDFGAAFYNKTLGALKGVVSVYNYNYFFNSILTTADGETVGNQLKGSEIAVGGDYRKQIGSFAVDGSLRYNVAGDLTGNVFNGSVSYVFNDKHRVKVALHSSSGMPDFNFLLYQSDYLNYNWQNTTNFEKERVNSMQVGLDSPLWGNLSMKFSALDNYTYFSADPNAVFEEGLEHANIKPLQEADGVTHLKIKYAKEFRLGKFALNNTVMYQSVSQDQSVLNVPQLVTRNTLYFSSDVFKKAMYLQTGVTLKYFTSYTMDAYNPVLGEFFVQNNEELGGFPLLDFFINAKVKQTRIYLKAEHFNSSFTGFNYYTAPNYPFRDFVVRFGLVWNFFS